MPSPSSLKHFALVCSFLAITTIGIPRLSAQSDQALEAGLRTFDNYEGSNIDVVSTVTGKLHVHIPLLSYPQLGGRLHANFFINYDSAAYQYISLPGGHDVYEQVTGYWFEPGAWVQTDAFPLLIEKDIYADPPTDHDYNGSVFTLYDPNGTTHRMGAIPASGQTQQLRALDGSGYFVNSSNWNGKVVYDADGNTYSFPLSASAVAQDTFGNQMTSNGSTLTDTVQRSIPFAPGATPGCHVWNVPGQNSGTEPYTLCYTTEYGNTLLTSLELPDGSSYGFTYEQVSIDGEGDIAELQQITLPTGGTITYTWTSQESLGCSAPANWWRMVSTRTINDQNGHQAEWQYSRSVSGNVATVTVIDPLGNKSIHTSTGFNNQTCDFFETQSQQQDNAGHTLRTVNTGYQWVADTGMSGIYSDDTIISVAPTSVETTLNDISPTYNSTTSTAYFSNTFGFCDMANMPGDLPAWRCQAAQQTAQAMYIANPTSVAITDYSTGTGSTLRTTSITYEASESSTYLNANELNL